jgi:transposase
MLNMYKQITIKTLHAQGVGPCKIARQLGCHRNTVPNVLGRETKETQVRHRTSGCTAHHETIKGLLKRKVSNLRIFEILRDEYGLQKSYSAVCRYINTHLPKPVEAYGVQVTEPGEEGELDFGYLGKLPGRDGIPVKTWGLALILSYSRKGYYCIVYDQTFTTLVGSLKKAFKAFGGVPKRIKVDNMKTAIVKNCGNELEFNADFLEFAHHCGFVIKPCTPYHPEQKGKVESAVKYLKNNFIAGRSFRDSNDLSQQLREWIPYANGRTHGTTRKIPTEVFQHEEQSMLQPLPQEEYALFQRATRIVQANSHVQFGNNYYSVPCQLITREVTVRWGDHLLRVIHKGEEVALHHLSDEQGEYITVRSHLPDYKIYSDNEYQTRNEQRMVHVGAHAHQYFQYILKTRSKDWARIVRAVLGLVKIHGNSVVNLTLKRALHYEVTDLTTIKGIIQKQLYLEGEEPPLLKTVSSYQMSRDLHYYASTQ